MSRIVLALALAAGVATAQEAGVTRILLPDLDVLELPVPPDWQASIDSPPGGGPPLIQLGPRDGEAFEVYVTPEWRGPPGGRVVDAETLRQQVRDAAERSRVAAGPQPRIRRLQGADGIGFYFVASDEVPEPDGYRHLCQGVLQTGGLLLRFEVLTNDGQASVVEAALALLQEARHRETGADQR